MTNLKYKTISHQFVDKVPDSLVEGVLYISIPYATAIHKCLCGCGNEVVTPFSRTDWKMTFDGEMVSLNPSIGNWNFPCMSHYWIKNNQVQLAPKWSREEIDSLRNFERTEKDKYFKSKNKQEKKDIWKKVKSWFN